mgnify:CR=1 FL=1
MIEEQLLEIINELLEDEGEETLEYLNPSYHLKDDIGFDSLTLAQLTVMIESKFGVDIYADGIVHTVQEVYDKLNRQ